MNRRHFILGLSCLGAGAHALAHPLYATRGKDGLYAFGERTPQFGIEELMPNDELRISHFDVVEFDQESILLRCVAKNGAFGVTAASPNKWWELKAIINNLIVPLLEGEDALEIEEHWWRFLRSEYEYAGAPLWNAWGHVECAVLDLIGQVTGKPVAEILGGIKRDKIPMYISGGARGGDPTPELDLLERRLEETGCKGVKVKIARRMGRNADASEGWTESILSSVRARLGGEISLYVDANGAFDAPTAIGLRPLLEAHGVSMIEEPCPFFDTVMTGQVTAAYRKARSPVLIATGENEGNPVVWRDLIEQDLLDVGQPDPHYGGGMMHCMMIAKHLQSKGLRLNPHWPRQTVEQAPLIHFCAAAPELWGLQEYRSKPRKELYEWEADYALTDGHMKLPLAPGFGVTYDAAQWKRAKRL